MDNAYLPFSNVKKEDIIVRDNASLIPITKLVKPQQNPRKNISLVLAFDLAVSSETGGQQGFNLAKYTAKQLALRVLNGSSECAITSFDQFSYLNAGFKDGSDFNDELQLTNSIDDLIPSKTSNYAAGLASYPVSALAEASRAKHSKAIVLISDRKTVKLHKFIMDEFLSNDVKFYSIVIDNEIQNEFREICDSTGGFYIDNVIDSSAADIAVNTCLSFMYEYKPMEIYYDIHNDCSELHIIDFETQFGASTNKKLTDSLQIRVPQDFRPALEMDPRFISFSAVLPGSYKDIDIKLTAYNDDIVITDFYFSTPLFEIIKGGPDSQNPTIRIDKNTSHIISVRFTPEDSTLIFDSLIIKSNACFGKKVLITGGFPNTPPKERNLTLTKPLCGETLLIGDTVNVEWSGLLPNDVIQLEYSVNNGDSWNILAEDINGLNYNWIIPDIPTKNCLVRAIQLWPNNIGQTMDLWHELAVQSANFDKIGDLVVTASKDSSVSVWNSNNGFELHKLIGHKNSVRWANFSPNGKFVITASDDSCIKIWDISNPEEKFSKSVMTLKAHNAEVKSANYSPDASLIVTAGWDGYVKIWNAKTGDLIREVAKEKFRIWYSEFSPDGKYLMACGNSNEIKIWETKNWSLYRSFYLMNSPVIHGNFSPDSKRLVTAGWFGKAVMWNIESGDSLFTVAHPDTLASINPINSASFDFSGNYFLTTSVDNTARLWDANSGVLLKSLMEHKKAVQFAVFNFDGSRILTSSWDKTAKIWNLDKRDLQMDTSDCALTIDRASVSAFDIALEKTVVGVSKVFHIDTFLINYSDFKVKIFDIQIIGDHAGDFIINKVDTLTYLNSLDLKSADIIFSPSDIGIRKAEIHINIPGINLIREISGEGINPELMASYEYIDFGNVELEEFRDTTINRIVRNHSSSQVKVTSIEITGPDAEHFFIVDNDNKDLLQPGESLDLDLRFMPEFPLRSNAVLIFSYEGIAQNTKVLLLGEGVKPRIDTATIMIESFVGYENNVYDVPIRIASLNNDGFNPSITGFRADLRFNGTMLYPLFETFSSRVEDKDKIVTIDIPAMFDEDSILFNLKFKVVLGNDTISKLDLSNIRLIGEGRTALKIMSGEFRLWGYCEEGGARLFDSDGKISLSQNKPNPSTVATSIDFEVFESGRNTLFIVDLNGRVVMTLFDGESDPGKHSFIVDLKDLSAGNYFYILQTPTYRISRRMEISR